MTGPQWTVIGFYADTMQHFVDVVGEASSSKEAAQIVARGSEAPDELQILAVLPGDVSEEIYSPGACLMSASDLLLD